MTTIAVTLKIPDNAAYTALTALRRLGVDASRLERADIWQLETDDSADLAQRFMRNESLFNPNKHQLHVLESAKPRAGEVWIEEIDEGEVPVQLGGVTRARHFTGWRLFSSAREAADARTVKDAAEKLLCNPAIERAQYQ